MAQRVEEERAELEARERQTDALGGDELVERVLVEHGPIEAAAANDGQGATRARQSLPVEANARASRPRQPGHLAPPFTHFYAGCVMYFEQHKKEKNEINLQT